MLPSTLLQNPETLKPKEKDLNLKPSKTSEAKEPSKTSEAKEPSKTSEETSTKFGVSLNK
ncbi:hypothetical protein DICPUDRAFT_147701 [Dictyostelium purpureum]|uniref:Uncharacterized protein n=1 Tax=Dictyostelium purpureum TaxID=5786 RepID=F0Z965_DICPU|nr:uncharacterized protein DICPUDRAFT_147701 [Dictyostelium purpureum]EGC39500.1 hypothetical protein DICPUDRAFT_147701 [Dictyostelium purpureum]|eukprot:XP_003283947.1 hypothetical protein DICPUDRAFT_147701 [Dictyostelium purpureum]